MFLTIERQGEDRNNVWAYEKGKLRNEVLCNKFLQLNTKLTQSFQDTTFLWARNE